LQGVFAAARDITERKRAEEALRSVSLYTRSLIEASLDPMVTISPQGKITDVNKATEEATGVPRKRLIGSDFSDYFTEPDKAREGYQQVIARGLVRDYPLTMRHVSGHTMDVVYNAAVYRNEAGELQGVFAAARDITERKRAEEALQRQTKELERSNADLQQFAYVASHDLQEPLRIVAGFTQLLQQRYKGRLDSDADEFIAFAVDGANRMQRMINDLLAYSRVNTRNECFEAVALEDVLAQTLANLAMMIGENDAVVTHDPLPIVLANPTQMEHLLQNLVGNALKFRDDKPPRVHISAQAQGNEWVVSVQDNGMGIAPEYHDRIFAIFQRLHNRDAYPGNGIGLAVCKRIVERHGGRIWVESTPGKGSTFYFSIPREETANGHP
jgi:PAS domain S-box-containing protein